MSDDALFDNNKPSLGAPADVARETIQNLRAGKIREPLARDVRDAADRALRDMAVGKRAVGV